MVLLQGRIIKLKINHRGTESTEKRIFIENTGLSVDANQIWRQVQSYARNFWEQISGALPGKELELCVLRAFVAKKQFEVIALMGRL